MKYNAYLTQILRHFYKDNQIANFTPAAVNPISFYIQKSTYRVENKHKFRHEVKY